MPKARNRRERAIQVSRWCQANWPAGRPISIRWVGRLYDKKKREEYDAETKRCGRGLVVTISRARNRTWRETEDSVIHEHVHCIQWPVAGPAEFALDDHPAAFGAQYWEIKDNFDHRGGYDDAFEYPTE